MVLVLVGALLAAASWIGSRLAAGGPGAGRRRGRRRSRSARSSSPRPSACGLRPRSPSSLALVPPLVRVDSALARHRRRACASSPRLRGRAPRGPLSGVPEACSGWRRCSAPACSSPPATSDRTTPSSCRCRSSSPRPGSSASPTARRPRSERCFPRLAAGGARRVPRVPPRGARPTSIAACRGHRVATPAGAAAPARARRRATRGARSRASARLPAGGTLVGVSGGRVLQLRARPAQSVLARDSSSRGTSTREAERAPSRVLETIRPTRSSSPTCSRSARAPAPSARTTSAGLDAAARARYRADRGLRARRARPGAAHRRPRVLRRGSAPVPPRTKTGAMRLDLAVSLEVRALAARRARGRARRAASTWTARPATSRDRTCPRTRSSEFHAHRPLRRHVKTRLVGPVRRRRRPDRRQAGRAADGSDRGAREGHALEPGPALPPAPLRRPAARGHRPSPRQGHLGRPRLRPQPRRAPRAPGPLPHARDRPRVPRPRRGRPRRGRHVRRGPRPRAGAAADDRAQGAGGPPRRHALQDRRALRRRRPRLDPAGDRAHPPDPRALLGRRPSDPRRQGLRAAAARERSPRPARCSTPAASAFRTRRPARPSAPNRRCPTTSRRCWRCCAPKKSGPAKPGRRTDR